jgi:hypothetical protein
MERKELFTTRAIARLVEISSRSSTPVRGCLYVSIGSGGSVSLGSWVVDEGLFAVVLDGFVVSAGDEVSGELFPDVSGPLI